MNQEEIIFREATMSDKDGILNLFIGAFSNSIVTKKESNLWNWQIRDNPDGKPFIGLALINQQIVGHYAIIPYDYYQKNGEIIKVGLVVDVMVHPKFQRRGIFVRLSKFTLIEATKKLNLKFTIGYPFTGTTYNSVIPGHKKVGWILNDKLYFYLLPLKFHKIISFEFSWLKKIARLVGFFSSILFVLIKGIKSILYYKKVRKCREYEVKIKEKIIFNEPDIKFYSEKSSGSFNKKFDQKFLNHRFCTKPDSNYIIIRLYNNKKIEGIGIISISKLENLIIGTIVDFCSEKKEQKALLKELIRLFKQKDCDVIFMIDYKDSQLKNARNYLGFINTLKYYQIINWKPADSIFKFPEKPKLNYSDFDIF